MEKYGVCKTCYDKQDISGLEKLASGEFKCPTCERVVISTLSLDETIRLSDKINAKSPDSGQTG